MVIALPTDFAAAMAISARLSEKLQLFNKEKEKEILDYSSANSSRTYKPRGMEKKWKSRRGVFRSSDWYPGVRCRRYRRLHMHDQVTTNI
jgi:hypothetical protein